jgi:hypothetical protein
MDESDWGIQGADSVFGPVNATIEYAMAKVLVSVLRDGNAPSQLRARGEEACAALWSWWGPTARTSREADRFRADEMLLDLAFGKYAEIVRRFERGDAASGDRETAQRSLVRQCWLLSRIATGVADDEVRREAASRAVLLKYDYLCWEVKSNPLSAESRLVPMVLASWLYERITKGAAPTQEQLFASMAPRTVVEATASLRRAGRTSPVGP